MRIMHDRGASRNRTDGAACVATDQGDDMQHATAHTLDAPASGFLLTYRLQAAPDHRHAAYRQALERIRAATEGVAWL